MTGPMKFVQMLKHDLARSMAAAEQEIASETMAKLANSGPYWSGLFASAWEAELGDASIPADQEGTEEVGEQQQRETFTAADFPVPLPTEKLEPITIGNRMNYRAQAMDLEPGPRTNPKARRTAPLGWFETFSQGGEQLQITKRGAQTGIRALRRITGFRR